MYGQDRLDAIAQIGSVDILMKDPGSQAPDGTELVPDPESLSWHKALWHADPDQCFQDNEDWSPEEKHCTTMCPECIESWMCDWWVRVWDLSGERILFDSYELAIKLTDMQDEGE